jgi:hypothetical protein
VCSAGAGHHRGLSQSAQALPREEKKKKSMKKSSASLSSFSFPCPFSPSFFYTLLLTQYINIFKNDQQLRYLWQNLPSLSGMSPIVLPAHQRCLPPTAFLLSL